MNMIPNNPMERSSKPLAVYIHVVIWILIFASPLIFEDWTSHFSWKNYLYHVEMPVIFCIIFYLNYCLLVPQYYMQKRYVRYLVYNVVMIAGFMCFQHGWLLPYMREIHEATQNLKPVNNGFPRPPRMVFIARDLVMLGLTAGLGATIRMSSQWQEAETARQEAELKNLRNQLNPHFLLNTLNNIYALIAFDTEKAQQTVQDLSRLLRYVLYESQLNHVPLCKEIDFIQNYIDLMRIRVHKDVQIKIDIQTERNSQTPIAPLLFISLIENAFKHGISSTEPSFIHICIREEKDTVCCEISNSNHPKNKSDKSGSGIGLEQVKKRLELIYPGKYTWKVSLSEDHRTYTSYLSIRIK